MTSEVVRSSPSKTIESVFASGAEISDAIWRANVTRFGYDKWVATVFPLFILKCGTLSFLVMHNRAHFTLSLLLHIFTQYSDQFKKIQGFYVHFQEHFYALDNIYYKAKIQQQIAVFKIGFKNIRLISKTFKAFAGL